MNPEKGAHVKCLLRNNLMVEGLVESWSDEKSVLKSLDEKSLSIIQHSANDIILIKIILINDSPETQKEIESEISQKLKETLNLPDDEFREKNIADLKILANKQEKLIITNKLREHHASEVRKTRYGYPGFLKEPSTK